MLPAEAQEAVHGRGVGFRKALLSRAFQMFRQLVGKHTKVVVIIIGQLVSCHHFVRGIGLARLVQPPDGSFHPLPYMLQALCDFCQIAAALWVLFGEYHCTVFPFSGEKFVACADLPGHTVVNHLEIDGSCFPFYPRGPELSFYWSCHNIDILLVEESFCPASVHHVLDTCTKFLYKMRSLSSFDGNV